MTSPYKSKRLKERCEFIKYSNKEEWRLNRCKGLGGSDVACILNLNPYKTANKLWREKKGIDIAEDISDKPYVQYGTNVEHILRELMALKNKNKYEYYYEADCVLESKEYPFMRASVDGLIVEKDTKRIGIWECKSANTITSQSKEKWSDGIPNNYYCQVIYYLAITGFDFVELDAELICMDKDKDEYSIFKHYHIERADVLEDIEYIQKEVIKWWNDYFIADKEPPLTFSL